MEITPLLGEQAAAIRKRCGLTQTELSALVERSRAQIARYEKNGEQVPSLIALAYRGLESLYRHSPDQQSG